MLGKQQILVLSWLTLGFLEGIQDHLNACLEPFLKVFDPVLGMLEQYLSYLGQTWGRLGPSRCHLGASWDLSWTIHLLRGDQEA